MDQRFRHIDDWIFDLDNCLYPHESRLFELIDRKMTAYIERLLDVDPVEARRIQKMHFHGSGTTLAGLMKHHDVDPAHFMADVHDIPLDRLARDDHAVLEVTIDKNGSIVSAQSNLALQGKTISSDVIRTGGSVGLGVPGVGAAVKVGADLTESGAAACGFGKDNKPDFWIGGEGGLKGVVHVAIVAESRASVDAFYKAALAAGGKDNGAPGIRSQYHEHYYGAFVLDPDGNNLEAVCHRPEEITQVQSALK